MSRILGVVGLLGVLYGLLYRSNPVAFELGNLADVANIQGRYGVLTLGAALVIIVGGIDLSVGSVVGCAAVLFGLLLESGWHPYVAVPVVLSMAVACLLLPLATSAASVALVMALIACGNGLGSGIVMTLGADAAPDEGRSQFLGAWRLCGDIGNTGGPLLVSAVAAVAPLATACLVVGVLGLAGAGWVGHWTGRVDAARRVEALSPRSP